MTSILRNGTIARALASASKQLQSPTVLTKRAAGYDADGNPSGATTNYTLQGVEIGYEAYRRVMASIPDKDTRFLLFQHGSPATPETGDTITVDGATYQLMAVSRDPAGATWECHARPV